MFLSKTIFTSMEIVFEDEVKWVIKRKTHADEDTMPDILIAQIKGKSSPSKEYNLVDYKEKEAHFFARRISREYPYLRQVGGDLFEDRRTGELVSSLEVVHRYGDLLMGNTREIGKKMPKWFNERFEKINVNLIKTQRLLTPSYKREVTYERTVEKYAEELSSKIKSYLAKSTELSSRLDRTYPNRLIERIKSSSGLTDEALNIELQKLEKKRSLLDEVGLIEIEKDSTLLDIEHPNEVVKDVLLLYIEDSHNKLEIFDDIAEKIKLLQDIINKRFKHKRLFIDKDKGFVLKSTIIKSNKGLKDIPVSGLSSGEQNELVLFYELLFKFDMNSLILIDEPEISLHISWQNKFIDDLREVVKLNDMDILIATHSPDIIGNNWGLSVELKGKE